MSKTGSYELSIGMPVFNGAKYLDETMQSLLSQTYGDFELIIADNASSDATRQMCSDYRSRDNRIRYIRHPTNIGAPRNWNSVVGEATGRYFKWASSNDLCKPEFLAECVGLLERQDDAVLCYTDTDFIDENSDYISSYQDPVDLTGPDPLERFMDYILRFRLALNNAQAGVIRTEVLRRTRLEGIYPHGDIPLMAELCLRGRFYRIEKSLFLRRLAVDAATPKRNATELAELIDPGATRAPCWRWRQCRDLLIAALRAPDRVLDRYRAAMIVLRTMNWRREELIGELRETASRYSRLSHGSVD